MKQLHITGLVSIANALRRELSHPLPSIRREFWRKRINATLVQIQSMLRQRGLGVEGLPAPSRRAYEFLKSVDLGNLPTADAAHPAVRPAGQVSWSGLTTFLERTLNQLAQTQASGELEKIHHSISITSRRIEGTIQRSNLRPDDLTPTSRLVRGWLAYFAERENLMAYADAVKVATPLLTPAAQAIRHLPPVVIHFRPTKLLFRLRHGPARRGSILWLPTPAIAFDASTFGMVAELISTRSRHAKVAVLEQMAAEPFQTVHAELESLSGIVEHFKGAYHDLAKSFERVNAQFFEGRMSRPHLTWSRAFTGRKFGHYDSLRDIVMVSTTLDQGFVPEFVVDYLMYHELLHKHLGTRIVDGRRFAHTAEFFALERKFPRFGEAEAILRQLAGNVQLA